MKSLGKPLTIHEAYEAFASQDLYQFKADDPVHIVRNEIRRHCVGLGFASASPHKLFTLTADGKYFILDTPVEAETRRITRRTKTWAEPNDIGALRKQYDAYLSRFRSGAVPVTLIDGPTIVDIMLDKSFGVEKKEELPVYTLALDLAFTE
jgi:restriction system protein